MRKLHEQARHVSPGMSFALVLCIVMCAFVFIDIYIAVPLGGAAWALSSVPLSHCSLFQRLYIYACCCLRCSALLHSLASFALFSDPPSRMPPTHRCTPRTMGGSPPLELPPCARICLWFFGGMCFRLRAIYFSLLYGQFSVLFFGGLGVGG